MRKRGPGAGESGIAAAEERALHETVKNESGLVVIVPMHDELARGTLGSVLDQAGVTADTFKESL